ncbi:hypothetical protein DFJ63DRAFT_104425 [Scheffersomyces coipomensis]|uniref:uncharacterized protein n=1 Tax=Scheffersomyces coipomensis TaxID=1788519 RepID=UPI00315CA0B8
MSLASNDLGDNSSSSLPQAQDQSTSNDISASPPSGTKNFSRTPTSWDAEDDILLMHLKDQQKLGWKEIASNFTNRTPNACQFRWRRLKSGNLKNPPKSAAALGSQIPSRPLTDQVKKPKKQPLVSSIKQETTSSFPSAYSPLSNATFTGYDNNISNALAGLNALSNSPSHISSPLPNYQISSQTNPSTPGLNSPSLNHHNNNNGHHNNNNSVNSVNSNNNNNESGGVGGPAHLNHTTYENSPKSEVIDRNNAPGNNATGGYYTDISIDPTMNLPHNQAHPQTPSSLTPRNSTSQASTNTNNNNNNNNNNNGNTGSTGNSIIGISTSLNHNNSIIQIVRDDRNSVTSLRASVSSLPSKSMNIPHHNSNTLAHLPILFGGAGGSISGPSRNSSISGSAGIQQTTVSSLRNGSIGSSSGYYSRSGSVVIPYNADKKDEDLFKIEKKKDSSSSSSKKSIKSRKNKSGNKSSAPVLNIPWTMEEDELLINRRNRELSFAELSILLPQRTEGEIWSRIDHLEKLRTGGHRATAAREHRRRRQSSIGLDDVDDFYDVDDVIGGMGSEEEDDEDEDDDVLVDVDDSIGGSRKRKKRRASSAVNPLTVTDSIRRRIR